MDKVLNQLRRRFIIVFMIVGGAFLLLAYGSIFVVNVTQTIGAIDNALTDVLDKSPIPAFDDREEWLQRSNCIILVRQDDTVTAFNADSLDQEILEKIVDAVVSDGEESFGIEGSYYKATWRNVIGNDITVYTVYDWTNDRADLAEAGVVTALVYFFCLVLLFIFGNMVAKQVVEPVKKSYEQQKKLVADASHELKTPIAIIGANLSLVASDPDSTVGQNAHWFKNMESQLGRMSALITDMLELHRADEAKSKPATTEDVSALLGGILLSFEARCFEKKVSLSEDLQPDVKTRCVKQNVERLYVIMMDNALKYTPEGGRIEVSLRSDRRNVVIHFKNYGVGIAKEHISKIFDRFYRVDNARTQSVQQGNSFGLGLSLAKSIVLDHEGTVTCESDGATYVDFRIELPLRQEKKSGDTNALARLKSKDR